MNGRLSAWQKGAIAVVSAFLAVPLIAFIALWVWTKSTAGDPPELFADVPQDFRDDRAWVARMQGIFPDGSPEAVLVARLEDEGFEVDPAGRTARYEWVHGYCNHEIHAGWSAEDGRVTDSFARYANICP